MFSIHHQNFVLLENINLKLIFLYLAQMKFLTKYIVDEFLLMIVLILQFSFDINHVLEYIVFLVVELNHYINRESYYLILIILIEIFVKLLHNNRILKVLQVCLLFKFNLHMKYYFEQKEIPERLMDKLITMYIRKWVLQYEYEKKLTTIYFQF
jgi:hypothetical protein